MSCFRSIYRTWVSDKALARSVRELNSSIVTLRLQLVRLARRVELLEGKLYGSKSATAEETESVERSGAP